MNHVVDKSMLAAVTWLKCSIFSRADVPYTSVLLISSAAVNSALSEPR